MILESSLLVGRYQGQARAYMLAFVRALSWARVSAWVVACASKVLGRKI